MWPIDLISRRLGEIRTSDVLFGAGCLTLIGSGLMQWLATPLQGKITAYALPLMKNLRLGRRA